MQPVHSGTWDPRPPSKHASPPPAPPPQPRPAHLSTPAKRITFYKSGDSRFGGVRMAVHRRSFKCFDALLDDLSQKVPLPFGVRTVTTPRGTHAIRHLEQLRDGGCYLCSDRPRPRPRPEGPPAGHAHLPYRQRRVLLVKNSEPGVRRSVVLNRRSTRSLGAFLDEASEALRFHVRRLYTVEGRKIDSVQSLMTCPGVLVCVGREAFSPTLAGLLRKSSEEKTPGLGPRTPGNGARSPATQGARSPPHGAQSRASQYSEGLESKKSVNFGLETRKSIIHPRSDSSNRSTRFSLSSEKSYGAGSSYPHPRPAIVNDDIEKRVLVNKDGSLSVEMRVRFRLHNDETLQWSTQIRKSPSLTNESCALSEGQSHYLQKGQSESCSDPESAMFDPEGMDYSGQSCVLEGNHCPCCYHRQDQKYDLWENPANHPPPHPPPRPSAARQTHSSSSSSSCNSRRVVRCRARLSDSGSEQGRLVREETTTCVTEQVEHRVQVERDGDTCVEICQVNRSCSRSEVIAVDGGKPGEVPMEEEVEEEEDEGRPISAVSSSSHVLRSLKEDEDDGDDDLLQHGTDDPKSEDNRAVSGSSARSGLSANSKKSSGVCSNCGGCKRGFNSDVGSTASQMSNRSNQASPKPASPVRNQEITRNGSEDSGSDGSAVSTQSNKTNLTDCGRCSAASNVQEGRASKTSNPETKDEERAPSVASATSQRSNKSHKSDCNDNIGAMVDKEEDRSHKSTSEDNGVKSSKEPEGDRTASSLSVRSGTSIKSHQSNCQSGTKTASPSDEPEDGMNKRAPSCLSVKSGKAERPESTVSTKSNVSAKTSRSGRSTCSQCEKPVSPCEKAAEEPDVEVNGDLGETQEGERAGSEVSAKSNLSVKSKKSQNKSDKASERSLSPKSEPGGDGEERAASEVSGKSGKSNNSTKSKCDCHKDDKGNGEEAEDRSASVLSGKTVSSAKSHHTKAEVEDVVDRPTSAVSAKSHASAKSAKSQKSNHTVASLNPKPNTGQNQDRVPSAMSVKSRSSLRSGTSQKSSSSKKPSSPNVVTIKTPEDMDDEENGDENEKVASEMLSPKGSLTPGTLSPRVPAASPTRSRSSAQQLSPGPGVGQSNAKSPISVKSEISKCRCGTNSAKTDKDGEEEEDLKGDGASDGVASIRSSSSKRHSASRNSSGSVSLGLPEDQDTAESDSGKSSVSFRRNAESEARKRGQLSTPEDSTSNKEQERSESSRSQNSKSPSSHNIPVVEIPIIETPGGGEDGGEEGLELKRSGAISVISVKSSVSHRSSCKCSVKASTPRPNGESSNKDGNDAQSETGIVEDTNDDAKNRDNEAKEEEDFSSNKAASVNSQNRCSLKPESVASVQSESKSKASKRSQEKDTIKPDYLKPVQVSKARSNAEGDSGSVKSSNSQKKSTRTGSPCPVDACSESTLSAADLLKETMVTARPASQRSKASKASGRCRSEKSGKVRTATDREDVLTPACLPNASPNEVVSDWLRSIPADGGAFTPDDALNEEDGEPMAKGMTEEVEKEEKNPENNEAEEDEKKSKPEELEEKEDEVQCEESRSKPAPVEASGTTNESLPKNWRSSAAVMKVLLSSSLGRCRSMPEVSPVYGRRLSTSARGLLDCLAQLQLIEPAVNSDLQKDHVPRYGDIMAILQSLWLTEPRDLEGGTADQVTPPRSSSGVGMSSGSGENGNQGGDETPQDKTDSLHEDEAEATAVEGKEQGKTNAEEKHPEKATGEPSSSDKSSANGDSKTPTDNEQENVEDSSSGTPPTVVRAPLSKRLSQDPDPVWVLHLLKKLEKQFMGHYVDAMTEFKVRWDLDDSAVLDAMIGELRDEVSQRIQKSVQLEMKKIQSRAGRAGRPPRPAPPLGANLSRESTMTEKRRRMLKVMKNQSVKTADSASDGETTGDFSDQRSDDEYCPCDACVRKKMAARPFRKNPAAADAPVMIEFDLLKILQLKKNPVPAPPAEPKPEEEADGDGEEEEEEEEEEEKERSLEVVQEEEEEDETKEEVKADVVLEETIAEEEEKAEGKEENTNEEKEEEDDGETGSEEEESDSNTVKEASGETAGNEKKEEEEVEETSESREEEEEEEEEPTCEGEEPEDAEEDSDAGAKRQEDAAVEEEEDGTLLHQVTRTSVESQPGSMEEEDADAPNTVDAMEVPKMGGGGGGTGNRRSRSPARVKRRKPKETGEEMENC
ncbi:retinitis pigmentosa 1-like 1 protein [Salarias fasciatus]|uniref:retinitis pigmentosa 1-like 1 protein n=1 Tax=Salarias fasciatus TaxID=181472 RepID=UPI001176FE0B|nr:retinitis pigmentosa 1-like 1 protein [Salarias fasciatus]